MKYIAVARAISKGQMLNNPMKKLQIPLNPEAIAFQIFDPYEIVAPPSWATFFIKFDSIVLIEIFIYTNCNIFCVSFSFFATRKDKMNIKKSMTTFIII